MCVDSFVVPVPTKILNAYKKMSKKCQKVWYDHGAVDYQEYVADDVKPGKWTPFPQSVKLKPDETVVFSWIGYKSRKDRDRVNKAVMANPRMKSMMDMSKAPFDGKRMIYGGFKLLLKA